MYAELLYGSAVKQSYTFHFVWNCYEKTGNNNTPFDFWGPPNRDAENLVITTPTACMVRDNQLFITIILACTRAPLLKAFGTNCLMYCLAYLLLERCSYTRTLYLTHSTTCGIDTTDSVANIIHMQSGAESIDIYY
jgi:hypothetical protein